MSKGFKSTYLRLLNGAAPAQADYWAARELIDNGYAHGHYQVSKSHLAYGQITALVGFAPTMKGRLYADELAEQQRKRTLRYRLGQAAFGLLSFGTGWVFGVFSQVAANLLTKHLGG
ncbi:MAG: hypothetical protein L6Q63_04095 [Giesbergeria sp.]|nr:hypothetical protein [Giesbergeria sp.]